jgi:anti-sigma regulatory factor (Ser/Thr protein kinase)
VPTDDEVRLAVPATPEFLRLARVTATGLASRLGFTYDEVEDLRLAIDELCFALIGNKGRMGQVSLRYLMVGNGLQVEGVGEFADDGPPAKLTDLSRQILAALVDDYDVGTGGASSFRLVKNKASA